MVAAESLGQVGIGNEAAVNALLKALRHDADMFVRGAAAKSLGQLGLENEVVVRALLKALHDKEEYVQEAAAGSLSRVGVGNEVVISALLDALRDRVLSISVATRSLEKIGTASALLAALRHANAQVRITAAESLGQVGLGSE